MERTLRQCMFSSGSPKFKQQKKKQITNELPIPICNLDFPCQANSANQDYKFLLEKLRKDITYSPQYLNFHVPKGDSKMRKLVQHNMTYRVFKADARLVRAVLESNGLKKTDGHEWNVMWLGTNAKQFQYQDLNLHQRINQFPCSNEITRKDLLAENIAKMDERFPGEYDRIIPETYVLPEQYHRLINQFSSEGKTKWIVKPCASSQGRGIYLVDNILEVPTNTPWVISRYIQNPYLINKRKFDLRIYVLITSFEPLRIYMYGEGLVRFASEKYSLSGSKSNKFVHLTNYAVNKRNKNFLPDLHFESENEGHKWSFTAFENFLYEQGVETSTMWARIYDLIIKTLLSAEDPVTYTFRQLNLHRNNCFNLYGFDVLLDADLKPWLMEVNLSPSMGTDSPLDFKIKSQLIADTMSIIRLRPYDRRSDRTSTIRNRVVSTRQTATRKSRFNDVVYETLVEYERRGNFLRIYPTKGSHCYDKYFLNPKQSNKAVYNALYNDIELKQTKDIHKIIFSVSPVNPRRSISSLGHQTFDFSKKHPKSLATSPKIRIRKANQTYSLTPVMRMSTDMVTLSSDDLLTEYMTRIVLWLKEWEGSQIQIPESYKNALELFNTHYIWQNKCYGRRMTTIVARIQTNLKEMKDRRKRLIDNLKRLITTNETDKDESSRQEMLQSMNILSLEEMLRIKSRDVQLELVQWLSIDGRSGSLLSEISNWMKNQSVEEDHN